MQKYSLMMRINHWISAILIIFLLSIGYYMTSLDNSPEKFSLYPIHKSFGFLAFIFVVVRIYYSLRSKKPKYIEQSSHFGNMLAKLGHLTLYLLTIAMVTSGILMSALSGRGIPFFGMDIPHFFETNKQATAILHQIHLFLPPIFIGLIVVHFLAWPYHKMKHKINIIKRIV